MLKANYSKQTCLKGMHLTTSNNISVTCTASSQCPISCISSCTLTSFSPNPSLPSQKMRQVLCLSSPKLGERWQCW